MNEDIRDAKKRSSFIEIDEITDAIEMVNDDWDGFLDLEKMEVIWLAKPSLMGFYKERDERWELIENRPDRFVKLPQKCEIDDYRIMEGFVCSIDERKIHSELSEAIRGKGAFRKFKKALYNCGAEEQWYSYQRSEYEKTAIRWCEINEIPFFAKEGGCKCRDTTV